MQNVIDRLKASKIEETRRQHAEGFAVGAEWAKENAAVRQLRALDSWYRDLGDSNRAAVFSPGEPSGPNSLADDMANEFLVGRESSDEPSKTVEDAWDRAIGEENADDRRDDTLGDPDWLRGFAEGALSIWDKVKSRV